MRRNQGEGEDIGQEMGSQAGVGEEKDNGGAVGRWSGGRQGSALLFHGWRSRKPFGWHHLQGVEPEGFRVTSRL